MTHILHSSESTDWQTPEHILERVRAVAPIALDPCTTEANPTGATEYLAISEGSDGLEAEWAGVLASRKAARQSGLVFCNPRYGRYLSGSIEPDYEHAGGRGRGWAEKIAQFAESGGHVLSLVPTRTETRWWKRLFFASDLVCLGPRIAFIDPATGKPGKSPNHASTFFYTGPNEREFISAFSPIGIIVQPSLSLTDTV